MSLELPRAFLLDARTFSGIAVLNGIRTPERQLVVTGQLTPLQVGRRGFYDWREVLALIPEHRRARFAKFAVSVEKATKAGAR